MITDNDGIKKFIVDDVRMKENEVQHYGYFEGESFLPGESVKLLLDKDKRMLHAKLHSAGHLLGTRVYIYSCPSSKSLIT
jgi:Ser-tRNA(Ala) deacylase AlaX